MKIIRKQTKLALNKRTIAGLGLLEMNDAQGGTKRTITINLPTDDYTLSQSETMTCDTCANNNCSVSCSC
ncbi:MAG: hypothetical protein GY765_11160 [bacterium]|nr:hypothetical protein [bacterium]